jgi:hypothetical protein
MRADWQDNYTHHLRGVPKRTLEMGRQPFGHKKDCSHSNPPYQRVDKFRCSVTRAVHRARQLSLSCPHAQLLPSLVQYYPPCLILLNKYTAVILSTDNIINLRISYLKYNLALANSSSKSNPKAEAGVKTPALLGRRLSFFANSKPT